MSKLIGESDDYIITFPELPVDAHGFVEEVAAMQHKSGAGNAASAFPLNSFIFSFKLNKVMGVEQKTLWEKTNCWLRELRIRIISLRK